MYTPPHKSLSQVDTSIRRTDLGFISSVAYQQQGLVIVTDPSRCARAYNNWPQWA
ncbi:hypothetical protein K443DRAFT_15072 [Laccaria amethystina LaAM-08-1]|uniref:Uncharacterized protein n=1 Tax=Laccaria amethystina LaAM-08-1 TaxID=1095629 RepID=A0A0C9WLU8_9AGAR|nr:hypothetical protein K443DRAFT_15072 [Laccaria amethystina LaAM-08-1]